MAGRRGALPLYHQVKAAILHEIEAGHFKADQQLPTEDQLSERFRVSKITVRQALRELVHLGYIRREQGRGTFVQRLPLEQGPRKLTSFSDEMRRRGMRATSQVLAQAVVPATDELAAFLELAPAAPLFRLCRLRCADDEPIGIQTAHLPLARVPGIDRVSFDGASLYEILRERYGLLPSRARETHVAVLVGADDARVLRVSAGAPGIAVERVTYLADGHPLEHVHSIMRGDRYKIVLDLIRPRGR